MKEHRTFIEQVKDDWPLLALAGIVVWLIFGGPTDNSKYAISQGKVYYLTNSYELVEDGKCVKFISSGGTKVQFCGAYNIIERRTNK